jgi:hypothetical protein
LLSAWQCPDRALGRIENHNSAAHSKLCAYHAPDKDWRRDDDHALALDVRKIMQTTA